MWAKKVAVEISFHNIEIWNETRASKFGWTTALNTHGDICKPTSCFYLCFEVQKPFLVKSVLFHPLFLRHELKLVFHRSEFSRNVWRKLGRSEKADENRTGLIQPAAADSVWTCESIGFVLSHSAGFVRLVHRPCLCVTPETVNVK